MKDFFKKLQIIVNEEQIIQNELLSRHTTFRVGGPCDFFVTIQSEEELMSVVQLCKREQISFFVIGNGSNLLVPDEGYRGVILKLSDAIASFHVEDKSESYIVSASAGMNLSAFAMRVARIGLTGLEFAAGIPGTLGGAVYMNAGAYGGEIKDTIISARVLTPEGEIQTLTKEELHLSYRRSSLQMNGCIVLQVSFELRKGASDEILKRIEELNYQRKEKQPLEFPSAGSTFKRPEGHYAGKLIMDAGLRGYRVGGAMISEKHCGFVINTGGATSQDILTLISEVSRIVYEKFGVKLEPEVRVLG